MVTACGRISTLIVFTLLLAANAHGQTLSLTGGVSAGHEVAGTLGAEATVRIARPFAAFFEATHLWNIASEDLETRATTIAAAVGATAKAEMPATLFEAGIQFRVPVAGRVQPYISVGGGAARVRAKTSFAVNGAAAEPNSLGIQLGSDFSSTVTKPAFVVGGGAIIAFGDSTSLDLGVRYDRIFKRLTRIPADTDINAVRIQAGIGVRF